MIVQSFLPLRVRSDCNYNTVRVQISRSAKIIGGPSTSLITFSRFGLFFRPFHYFREIVGYAGNCRCSGTVLIIIHLITYYCCIIEKMSFMESKLSMHNIRVIFSNRLPAFPTFWYFEPDSIYSSCLGQYYMQLLHIVAHCLVLSRYRSSPPRANQSIMLSAEVACTLSSLRLKETGYRQALHYLYGKHPEDDRSYSGCPRYC